jgi:hypothetical protein
MDLHLMINPITLMLQMTTAACRHGQNGRTGEVIWQVGSNKGNTIV